MQSQAPQRQWTAVVTGLNMVVRLIKRIERNEGKLVSVITADNFSLPPLRQEFVVTYLSQEQLK